MPPRHLQRPHRCESSTVPRFQHHRTIVIIDHFHETKAQPNSRKSFSESMLRPSPSPRNYAQLAPNRTLPRTEARRFSMNKAHSRIGWLALSLARSRVGPSAFVETSPPPVIARRSGADHAARQVGAASVSEQVGRTSGTEA